MNTLESRVDWLERQSQIRTVGALRRKDSSSGAQDADKAQPAEDALEIEGVDYLLRSILGKQSMHTTNLRNAVRGQERLQSSVDRVISKLNSVEETVRAVDRSGRGLAELLKARQQSS